MNTPFCGYNVADIKSCQVLAKVKCIAKQDVNTVT